MPDDTTKGGKLGRKGDVRMHIAVNARLTNPDLSLFDALIIGGFRYAASEDANALDHEGVTLGQRKNQLSRRLRMVRKNSPSENQESGSDVHSVAGAVVDVNPTGSGAAFSRNAQKDLQRLMQHGRGEKNKRPTVGNNSLAARALQMKDEQTGLGELSDEDLNVVEDEEVNKKQRVAKFHPDFAPIFVPPKSTARAPPAPKQNVCTPVPTSVMLSQGGAMEGQTGMMPTMVAAHGNFFSYPHLANPFAPPSHPTSRPSSVAISSLTHSAQAVGLTLEQLAINLAADSTTIAKILAENATSDSVTKKMKLALRLFEMEVKTLYSTSMLRAGFDPRECQTNTPSYREFAQNAWEREAARLKSSGVTWDVSLPDLEKPPGLSEDSEDERTHVERNGHDVNRKRSSPDGDRHMHRLGGECGHKAIIHKPKDGIAHVDFVVGDKVECYDGIDPCGRKSETSWPSRYKRRDTGEIDTGEGEQYQDLSDEGQVPKIIELASINLNDPEWNYDVTGSIDGGIAGLFRLGEKTDESVANV